jgi:hypothetical protein
MPEIFRYLCYVEFAVALSIGVGALLLALYLALWVGWGCWPDIHARLVQTIKGINAAWRADLIILVPLFFRPIFKFLIYLKEGPFGTKSELPPTITPPQNYGGGGQVGEPTQPIK